MLMSLCLQGLWKQTLQPSAASQAPALRPSLHRRAGRLFKAVSGPSNLLASVSLMILQAATWCRAQEKWIAGSTARGSDVCCKPAFFGSILCWHSVGLHAHDISHTLQAQTGMATYPAGLRCVCFKGSRSASMQSMITKITNPRASWKVTTMALRKFSRIVRSDGFSR